MKICSNCSTISEDSAIKCDKCGKDLSLAPLHNGAILRKQSPILSIVFKSIAIIIFIIGLITGIAIGRDMSTIFSELAMFCSWIGSFLIGLIFWGIGKIIENQNLILNKLEISQEREYFKPITAQIRD